MTEVPYGTKNVFIVKQLSERLLQTYVSRYQYLSCLINVQLYRNIS